jgi:hypothetical protein
MPSDLAPDIAEAVNGNRSKRGAKGLTDLRP